MATSRSAEPVSQSRSAPGSESVSVVMPCYNEERFIAKALENLVAQYDHERYEIVVVDGVSEDRTREVVADFQRAHSHISVKLVDNPARDIPTGLNRGIAAARGEIIARIDAHALASQNYIRRCVEILREGKAAVVGMPCRVCPSDETLMARAIAAAVSHPFGIGDAKYRLGSGSAPQEAVDTVAFACFRKSLWQDLGGFNEELLTNEDYDFNYRVRLNGGLVLLDRSGYCDYFARGTLSGLAAQYFRYGQWKARMLRLHPHSVRWRHLIAPLFVASLVVTGLLGTVWYLERWLLVLELGLYLTLGLVLGRQRGRNPIDGLLLTLLMPLVFLTIHLSWGSSFFLGLVRRPVRRLNPGKARNLT